MIGISAKCGALKRLARDRRGNFGLMTALILPVAMATVGIAIDMTSLMQTRSELQGAADSAALAAASALAGKGITDDEAKALARKFMVAQMANLNSDESDEVRAALSQELESSTLTEIVTTPNGSTGSIFDVTVNAAYTVPMNAFTRLLSYETVKVAVSSSTQSSTESKNALSMFLVLDRSGSMAWITDDVQSKTTKCQNHTEANWYDADLKKTKPCYVTKIAALKTAVGLLSDQLNEADPETKYVRTAAVSYNDSTQTETTLAWGTTAMETYVNNIPTVPTGGTASSGAMAKAYQKIMEASEITAHTNMNGQTNPGKYIVFMTDGANNYSSDDTSTKATCTTAKNAGVEIFSVAFMAPSAGQKLLSSCATDASHYYDADDADELAAAFKEIGEKASLAATRLTQ